VVAIVVNWNGALDTLRCVDSIQRSNLQAHRIYVVDNASEDESLAVLERSGREFTLLVSRRNLGFAGGCNLAIREALRGDAQYVWLLNNDAVADEEALATLVLAAEADPLIGAAGSRIVYASNPNCIWHEGGHADVIRGIAGNDREGEPAGPPGPVRDTAFVSGCSMLLRSSCLAEVGLLDPAFFLYYEDVEFSVRARRSGWRVVVEPQSVVRHQVSVSTSRLPELVRYLQDRNRALFAFRCAPTRAHAAVAFLYHAARAVRYVAIPRFDQARLGPARAFLDAVRLGARRDGRWVS
jgi:GT2 family glycosyltransferase